MHPVPRRGIRKSFFRSSCFENLNRTHKTKEEIAMCFKRLGLFWYSNLWTRYLNSGVASLGKRLKVRNIWYQGINLTYLISWNSCVRTTQSFRPLLFFRVAVQALHDHHQRFEMHGDCYWMIWSVEMLKIKLTGNYYAIKITALSESEQGTYYFFSYRFYNAVHWKRRDRAGKALWLRDEGVKEELREMGQTYLNKRICFHLCVTWLKQANSRASKWGALAGGKLGGRPWHRSQEKVNKLKRTKGLSISYLNFQKVLVSLSKTVYYSQG